MGRARVVHPKFFLSEALFEAERASGLPCRLAYEGLWCEADRDGRFEWKPRVLQLAILPFDTVDFGAVLDALELHGFIRSYDVAGKRYGWIPQFLTWQKPHPREAKSRLPPPPKDGGGKPANKASPRPAEGAPEAGPNDADRTPPNPVPVIPLSQASPGHTQGEPRAGLGQEKSAGLEDYKRLEDSKVSSVSDWRSSSDLGTTEDGNGLSCLRTASPAGAAVPVPPSVPPAGVGEPPPPPSPEEVDDLERRRAGLKALIAAHQAAQEGDRTP